MAPPEASWSTQVPCRVADSTPMGMPSRMIQTIVSSASRMEVSAPPAMTSITGVRKNTDVPKSPCSAFPSQMKYWT